MITYARRFHSSGRRKRLKAKIKLLIRSTKSSNKEDPKSLLSLESSKAGPCLIDYSQRTSEDSLDPIDTFCEKNILKKAFEQQALCASILNTPVDPPTYIECVASDITSVTALINEPDLKQNVPVLPVTQANMTSTDSETSQISEGSETCEDSSFLAVSNGGITQKEPERGRRREILYRSQLNDLAARKRIFRPSPRSYKEAKVNLHSLICFNTLAQMNQQVEGWKRKFLLLRVLIVIAFVILFTII